MDVRTALKMRWEMREDIIAGIEPPRHKNTLAIHEATCVLAWEFEKTAEAIVTLLDIIEESKKPLDVASSDRRIDSEGRDVTDLPGLWSEDDIFKSVDKD